MWTFTFHVPTKELTQWENYELNLWLVGKQNWTIDLRSFVAIFEEHQIHFYYLVMSLQKLKFYLASTVCKLWCPFMMSFYYIYLMVYYPAIKINVVLSSLAPRRSATGTKSWFGWRTLLLTVCTWRVKKLCSFLLIRGLTLLGSHPHDLLITL